MTSAIFLDRDGTLNEEMGYINHPQRLHIFPFAAESVKIFNQLGYKVIVVTNQSGIARGYFSEDLLKDIHMQMQKEIEDEGGHIDAFYYCPHHPTEGHTPYRINCSCRKPKAGMIKQAVRDFQIRLETSYGIGDRYKDILFARQNKMQSGFVLTGYGQGEFEYQRDKWEVFPDIVGENLLDLARKIRNKGQIVLLTP